MQSRGSHPSLRMINVCCPTLGMNSIKQQAEDIEIDVQADELELSIDRAVPLGLILNEAATNSLKHAFGPDAGGRISASSW